MFYLESEDIFFLRFVANRIFSPDTLKNPAVISARPGRPSSVLLGSDCRHVPESCGELV